MKVQFQNYIDSYSRLRVPNTPEMYETQIPPINAKTQNINIKANIVSHWGLGENTKMQQKGRKYLIEVRTTSMGNIKQTITLPAEAKQICADRTSIFFEPDSYYRGKQNQYILQKSVNN